jgi:Cdc6-like AAA superfamily ATPase
LPPRVFLYAPPPPIRKDLPIGEFKYPPPPSAKNREDVLFGRQKEIEQFATFLGAADFSTPTPFALVGEGGMGKTLLLDNFAQRLFKMGVPLLKVKCEQVASASQLAVASTLAAAVLSTHPRLTIEAQLQVP